jgi:Mrp family chromosome partitioning ATPase
MSEVVSSVAKDGKARHLVALAVAKSANGSPYREDTTRVVGYATTNMAASLWVAAHASIKDMDTVYEHAR